MRARNEGDYERAFAEFDRAIELGGRSVNHIGVLGYAYGRSGNRDRAKEHLQELNARAAHGYVPPMWIALVHLGLGDLEGLFHWLDRAFEERDGSLILITAAVEFDPVREDPRFKSLLQRMGLGHLASPGLSTLLYSRSRWSGNGPNTAGRVRRARASSELESRDELQLARAEYADRLCPNVGRSTKLSGSPRLARLSAL